MTMMMMNSSRLDHYMSLDQSGKVQAEYIWIGGTGSDLRGKTKTLNGVPNSIDDLPIWNFDGSSTKQADGHDSEVLIKPVKMVRDPFRKGNNILVLCECILPSKTGNDASASATIVAAKANNRRKANEEVFELSHIKEEETWFGLEQEYTLFESDGKTPLGWPVNGFPAPQGPYYCGVGTNKACGRAIVEAHYRACLYAGLEISGINAEVMPGQWEFQVGPCIGIDSGDSLWLARYILERVAEDFNCIVSFDNKPIKGDWNGAGCHTNYSTKSMRSKELGGYNVITKAIEQLGDKHKEAMQLYGEGNEQRLTGAHETAHFSKFSFGVANRGASVRIPRESEIKGCGYFEDRRPGANCDPYQVTSFIAKNTLHAQKGKEEEQTQKSK